MTTRAQTEGFLGGPWPVLIDVAVAAPHRDDQRALTSYGFEPIADLIEVPRVIDIRRRNVGSLISIDVGVADSYQLEAEHFGVCLIEGTALSLPPEEGLKNMRVIDAIYRSARDGKPAAL